MVSSSYENSLVVFWENIINWRVDLVNYPYLHLNDAPYTINGVFRNLGIDTISNMKINYSINGGNTVSEYISNLNIFITFDFLVNED